MTTAPLSNDARAIEELRSKLGGRLTIVGHPYEQEATIQHCDIRGDSVILNDEEALTGQEAEITLDAYRALACAVWEHLDTYGAASAPNIPDLRVWN